MLCAVQIKQYRTRDPLPFKDHHDDQFNRPLVDSFRSQIFPNKYYILGSVLDSDCSIP
jgi:hypothetical protein